MTALPHTNTRSILEQDESISRQWREARLEPRGALFTRAFGGDAFGDYSASIVPRDVPSFAVTRDVEDRIEFLERRCESVRQAPDGSRSKLFVLRIEAEYLLCGIAARSFHTVVGQLSGIQTAVGVKESVCFEEEISIGTSHLAYQLIQRAAQWAASITLTVPWAGAPLGQLMSLPQAFVT